MFMLHPKYVKPLACSITISKVLLIFIIYYFGAPYVSAFIESVKPYGENVDRVVTEKANNVFDVFSPFLLCDNLAERDGAKVGIAICVLMVLIPLAIALVIFALFAIVYLVGGDYHEQVNSLKKKYKIIL